jgi:hypothetical protein
VERVLHDLPGFEFEPLEAAARRSVAWNLEHGRVHDASIIDDRIVAAYQARTSDFAI